MSRRGPTSARRCCGSRADGRSHRRVSPRARARSGAVGARVNLGNALQQTGDLDGAVAELEEARALAPEAARSPEQSRQPVQGPGTIRRRVRRIRRRAPRAPRLSPRLLEPARAHEAVDAAHRPSRYSRCTARSPSASSSNGRPGTCHPATRRIPSRRLRIGYVSPDCHTALPAFVLPVLRHHDRERFEVFAYFNNPQPAETLARVAPIASRVMKGAPDADGGAAGSRATASTS